MTPNAVHRDNVVAAAGIGKHVLCEKPMAVSSPECREMIEACAKAGVKLMIAYRCQYEPFNRALVKAVRGGSLGKARLIQAFNGQTTGCRSSGGSRRLSPAAAPCPISGSTASTGSGRCWARSRTRCRPSPTRPRTIRSSARSKKASSSRCASLRRRRAVHVELRSPRIPQPLRPYLDGAYDLQNAFAYHGQRLFVGRAEGKSAARDEKLLTAKNQFALEIDHFSRCVQENIRPRTPGEEGLQDQILMEAIYESARTGAPVKTGPLPARRRGSTPPAGRSPKRHREAARSIRTAGGYRRSAARSGAAARR